MSHVIHWDRLAGLAVPQSVHTSFSASLILAWGWFWLGIGPSQTTQDDVLNGTTDLQYTQVPIWNKKALVIERGYSVAVFCYFLIF